MGLEKKLFHFNVSYADQTGHYRRGVYKELENALGKNPKCTDIGHIEYVNKRKMRRITKDGKNKN